MFQIAGVGWCVYVCVCVSTRHTNWGGGGEEHTQGWRVAKVTRESKHREISVWDLDCQHAFFQNGGKKKSAKRKGLIWKRPHLLHEQRHFPQGYCEKEKEKDL